jgi:hypothetical protein
MAVNGQYSDPPFGMSQSIAHTGATGSEGVTAAQSSGPVVGSVMPRSVMFAPSTSIPEVQVVSGDTCSSSADGPVPPSGDPMTGLSLAQICETGAGAGTVHGAGNPTAGGGR